MARLFKKRIENKGLPPGSLVFIGTKKVHAPSLELISYNKDSVDGLTLKGADDIPAESKSHTNWINITGIDNVDFMRSIQLKLGIHPLAMEDIMNTGHRAKIDDFEDFTLLTLKMLRLDDKDKHVVPEQVSFILRENELITFQEEHGDTFDAVRKRITVPTANLRKFGTDYLTYALLDSIIDNYVYIIEGLGEKIDDLELMILDDPDKEVLHLINSYKRDLHLILKVVKPVNELLNNIKKSENALFTGKRIQPFYKDLGDLIIHVVESVEAYRSVLNDYIQVYHSSVSNKMNDIMKVLTIFSAIFIPLSFFAGVYGTNFQYFPELQYRYAYFIFWGVAVMMAVGMLLYFKKKKWL